MVVESSQFASKKYMRRISKDICTVRRISVINSDIKNSPALSRKHSTNGLPSRKYSRKRSSISSTLTRVLILNVRDLLRTPDPSERQVCFTDTFKTDIR